MNEVPPKSFLVGRLWKGGIAVLVVVFLLDFIHIGKEHEAHYTVDGWFGFFSIYGFVACVILVVGSKALGLLLKRKEDYYDD